MGTCRGTREWLRSNCSRSLYQMPIPCRNTSCKPERWNENVLGSAPRRLTPPTASRNHTAQSQAVHRIPRNEGHHLFRHHRGVRRIVQDLSQEGVETQERAHESLPVLAQPAHIYRCRQESIVAQPDKRYGIREERST